MKCLVVISSAIRSKTFFILLICNLSLGIESNAQDPISFAVSSLTGQQLVNLIKDSANEIIEKAGDEARDVATRTAAELNTVASTLERALGKNINKPLSELRITFEKEVERALAAWSQTQYFLSSIGQCLSVDLKYLLASLEGTINSNINSSIPWSDDRPLVTNVYRVGTTQSYGLRTSTEQVLIIEGSNLDYDSTCGVNVTLTSASDSSNHQEISFLGGNSRRISLLVKPINEPGVYNIKVSLGQKSWFFGCSDPNEAFASIAVLPKADFKVNYTITPTCLVNKNIAFQAGELHLDNKECNGTKHASGNFKLPDEWTYVSHQWVETSNSGKCGLSESRYTGSNTVYVKIFCEEQGGPFCTGPNKFLHGDIIINGVKEDPESGSPIMGEFPSSFTYGQTITIIPVSPENNSCTKNSSWSLSVSLTYPDGSIHSIPTRTGSGSLTSSAGGATYQWDPLSYSLSVTAPSYDCSGLWLNN